MSKLDDYRLGYEQGQKDAATPLNQSTAVIGQGLYWFLASDAFNKGRNDARDGHPFEPPPEE